MKLDRSSAKQIAASWVVFLAIVIAIVLGVYGAGWAESTKVPEPNHVRGLLIGIILTLALFANLLGRLLSRTRHLFSARGILSGIFIVVVLAHLGNFYAGRYLGGNAIGTPDLSGFHYLMYEGWGMMFIPLCVVFGVLTMLREGFEKRPPKK